MYDPGGGDGEAAVQAVLGLGQVHLGASRCMLRRGHEQRVRRRHALHICIDGCSLPPKWGQVENSVVERRPNTARTGATAQPNRRFPLLPRLTARSSLPRPSRFRLRIPCSFLSTPTSYTPCSPPPPSRQPPRPLPLPLLAMLVPAKTRQSRLYSHPALRPVPTHPSSRSRHPQRAAPHPSLLVFAEPIDQHARHVAGGRSG